MCVPETLYLLSVHGETGGIDVVSNQLYLGMCEGEFAWFLLEFLLEDLHEDFSKM